MLQEPCKEELSDWSHGLLAIGTLGNDNLKEDPDRRNDIPAENLYSSQDHLQELTHEELGNLQNNNKANESFNSKHLDLEVDRVQNNKSSEECKSKNNRFCLSRSLVLSRGKDVCLDNNNNAIGEKSLSFLLKKMFVCKNGFQPPPSLKDPLPSESRMEKILRGILHNKICPQGSKPAITKKYLETRNVPKSANYDVDELDSDAEEGSKWVKTDSEYIVLEI
ncbi:NGR2 [Quillaja saponaria]|uniref:NGR2 n=1 Tax=Quillaja saponaria TaxID=32244 RepID=A0AAD7VKV0_QUISA|nr:NGR2 [Quillaja saponaria]